MIPITRIEEISSAKGSEPAIILPEKTVSWANFYTSTFQYIAALEDIQRYKKLDTICFISPNRIELFYLLAAAASLKITTFGVDYTQSQEAITQLIQTADADAIIVSSSALTKLGLDPNELVSSCPSIDLDGQLLDSMTPRDFPELEGIEFTPRERPFRAIGFTSGTSGLPKVVLRTKSFDARRFAYFTARYGFAATDRHLVTIPLYHAAGNGWARLFLNLGATIILPPADDHDRAAAMLVSEAVTTAAMTPPIATSISNSLDANGRSTAPGILRFVLVGGKNFSPVDKEYCNRVLNHSIHEYYGTTETGVNTIAEPNDILVKPESVGKAYHGNEIIVVGSNLETLPCGETGRIAIHSYMNMDGYIGSDATALSHDDKDYILTNETGCLDHEGYLFLKNRNAASSSADLYEIEDEIKRLPCVSDAAVIPVTGKKPGSVSCGFVIRKDAVGSVESITGRIKQILKGSKIKSSIISDVGMIPYSPSGKVIVNNLIELIGAGKHVKKISIGTSTLIGVTLLAGTAVAWGGMFHIAKNTLTSLDAFHISLVRYGLAAVIFLALLIAVEGIRALIPGKDVIKLMFFGTLGFAGFSILAFWGLGSTRPEHGAIIMALMPLITVLIMWVWKRSPVSASTFSYIAMALLGVLLVVTKGDVTTLFGGQLIPNISILAGAVCWVIYTIGAKSFPEFSVLRYTALSAGFGAISILCLTEMGVSLNMLVRPSIKTLSSAWFELSYLVLIAGVAAVFSWNNGIKILDAVNGILFINLVPITALVFGWLRGHSFESLELIGGAITITALLLNNLYDRKLLRITFTGFNNRSRSLGATI